MTHHLTMADDVATGMGEHAGQRFIALGEMAGGIAHDFRNILAIVESSLRLIESAPERSGDVLILAAAAREGVARGMKLTSQLLAWGSQPSASTSQA